MQNKVNLMDNLIKLSEEEMSDLASLLFQKDYTSDAFSFIENHRRILNYWASDINLLPFEGEEGKRRKFSFFDLVWLHIVKELRDFGMEKDKIAVLKKELLTPENHEKNVQELKKNRKELEK